MTFYSSIHLKSNSSCYFYHDSHHDSSSINGCFTLISFNKKPVDEFYFKENLIGKEETFVRVNAIIGTNSVIGFIDLKKYPALLNRIKLLSVEEATQKINDYVFDILDINPIFTEDIAQLPDLFNRLFSGDTIEDKIASYELKRHSLESSNLLNKIFVNGLAIKIFKDEVPIDKLVNYRFIEFKIANQAKTDLRKAICKASFFGCESLVLFLLMNSKDQKNLDLVLINASFYGQKKIVENIFELYGDNISDKNLKNYLLCAVKKGHKEVVDYLLLKNPEFLGIALRNAAYFSQKILVEYFLEKYSGVILAEDLVNVVKFVSQNGPESTFEYILLKNPEKLEIAFNNAVYHGQGVLVENFLKKYGDMISAKNLKISVIFLAQIGSKSILENLLLKNLENVGLALSHAAYFGKEDLVKNLFEKYSSSFLVKDLENAIMSAAQKGHEDIFEYLLSKKPEFVGIAFNNAAYYEQGILIKNLFEKYVDRILVEDLKIIFMSAAQKIDEDIFEYILSKKPENAGIAINSASYHGKEILIKKIFENYGVMISSEDLKNAIISSVEKNHESILDYLLSKNMENFGITINCAVYYGKEILIKNLFEKYGNMFSTKELENSFEVALQKGHKSIALYILLKNPKISEIAVDIAASYGQTALFETILLNAIVNAIYYRKEVLFENLLKKYRDRSSVEALKKIIIFAARNNHKYAVCFLLNKLTGIQIPLSIKEAILEIKKRPPVLGSSWQRLLIKLNIFALSTIDKELKDLRLTILYQTFKKISSEAAFLGTPKKDNRELLSIWYSYIKDIMVRIESKIDADPTKDVEEKKNLLEAFNSCGGAWQSHLDQMKQRLIDFPEDIPIEILIGKIISDIVIRISELINKEFSEKRHIYPDVHNQNKIRFYLQDYIAEEVLDDKISNFKMIFDQIVISFLDKFNLEIIINEILRIIEANSGFKYKLDDYYKNQLFKGCPSNDEIELKIEADKIELEKELEKLEETKLFFSGLSNIIDFLPFAGRINILNLLICANKELFKFNIKKTYSDPLLTDEKISSLFSLVEEAKNAIIFLNIIKSFYKYSSEQILTYTKDQLMQLFIDNKQSRVEFHLVEDFRIKHVKDENLLPSGVGIILRKIGFSNI